MMAARQMRRHMVHHAEEEWPTTGEGTFDLPPIELAVNPTVKNWRGVRLGDVARELYYENDSMDFSRDFKDINVCAKTGQPPVIDPLTVEWVHKHTPDQVLWDNMTHMSGLYFIMSSIALKEASQVIGEGFSNTVPIESAYYSNFHMPTEDDYNIYEEREESNASTKEDVNRSMETLTLAVSYAHKERRSESLLKANEFQIAQLEDVLSAIREEPPIVTKFVRLWTDGAHSKKMLTTNAKERPKWILHGLLPYAVFPVVWLSSGDETDNTSLWSNCEQILADGALGCLFSRYSVPEFRPPRFGKLAYSRRMPGNAVKTVGDGLSLSRNLRKLAAAIHSGVLDDSVTYHIADAQELIRLAYYMGRKGNLSVAHAVNCEECLHATFRENMGFILAFQACSDAYDENVDEDMQLRLNKTQVSYPYPLVRARRGFVDWHGVRELAPGAGKFAKLRMPFFLEKCKTNMHVVTLHHSTIPEGCYCLVISAYPSSDGTILYIVLLVHGQNLFSSNCKVLYSVRLNIIDLGKLHAGVQQRELSGTVNEHFRHPRMDQLLSQFEFRMFLDISRAHWGA